MHFERKGGKVDCLLFYGGYLAVKLPQSGFPEFPGCRVRVFFESPLESSEVSEPYRERYFTDRLVLLSS